MYIITQRKSEMLAMTVLIVVILVAPNARGLAFIHICIYKAIGVQVPFLDIRLKKLYTC
jgi:hypothetical protein